MLPASRVSLARFAFVVPAFAALAGLASACSGPELTVEVLPPRTSISCAAPALTDPALGRGLLDAKATTNAHGGYEADLRVAVPGQNARVDGVDVKITRDGTELKTFSNVPTGDVLLLGTKDEVRESIVENVELVPRSVALDLAKDSTITNLNFATLVVEISPRVLDTNVVPVASTFGLDVCNGCLVDKPSTTTCAAVAANPVCRVGQDVPSFTCTQAAP